MGEGVSGEASPVTEGATLTPSRSDNATRVLTTGKASGCHQSLPHSVTPAR